MYLIANQKHKTPNIQNPNRGVKSYVKENEELSDISRKRCDIRLYYPF